MFCLTLLHSDGASDAITILIRIMWLFGSVKSSYNLFYHFMAKYYQILLRIQKSKYFLAISLSFLGLLHLS